MSNLSPTEQCAQFVMPPHIVAPEGAQLHIVRGVTTLLGSKWGGAISVGAPDTLPISNVWAAESHYWPNLRGRTGSVKADMFLLNYQDGTDGLEKALAWGACHGLAATHPRMVLALAQRHPELPRVLACDWVRLVAPTVGHDGICNVAFAISIKETERVAYVPTAWRLSYDRGECNWFVFYRTVAE